MYTSVRKILSILLSVSLVFTLTHVSANAGSVSRVVPFSKAGTQDTAAALSETPDPDIGTAGSDLVSSDLSSPLRSYFSDEPLEARDDTILSEKAVCTTKRSSDGIYYTWQYHEYFLRFVERSYI